MTYANKNLRNKIIALPEVVGVYKMLDKEKNIIYIGKSLCLKKRVKSYWTN